MTTFPVTVAVNRGRRLDRQIARSLDATLTHLEQINRGLAKITDDIEQTRRNLAALIEG